MFHAEHSGDLLICTWHVKEDAERGNVFRLDVTVDPEALAIFAYVVSEDIGARDRGASANLEQRHRRAGGERAGGVDRNRHQHAAGIYVEDFFAVSAPPRFGAAAARDLPLPRPTREGCDIDLPVAGFVRGIGEPLPIRRYLPVGLAATTVEDASGLSTGDRQKFQMAAARGLTREDEELIVQRPGVGNDIVHRGGRYEISPVLARQAARTFQKDACTFMGGGTIGQHASIVRPHAQDLFAGIEGEARVVGSLRPLEPDVNVVGLWVADVEGNPAAIGRERGVRHDGWIAEPTQFFSGPIDPGKSRLRSALLGVVD